MKHPDQDNLKALFERFMPPAEAEAAAKEVRTADEIMQTYPAPAPTPELTNAIKLQIGAQLAERHRPSHPFFRFVGAAAAVILVVLIGLLGRAPRQRPVMSHAALIPTAIWESDDIASDDLDLAYFATEISRIETQMRQLQMGEGENTGSSVLDEVEMELIRIDTEFWKE